MSADNTENEDSGAPESLETKVSKILEQRSENSSNEELVKAIVDSVGVTLRQELDAAEQAKAQAEAETVKAREDAEAQ